MGRYERDIIQTLIRSYFDDLSDNIVMFTGTGVRLNTHIHDVVSLMVGGRSSMSENQPPDRINEKFTDGIKPQWWSCVPPGKISRLYADDARGLVDEDLIDDVGASGRV